MYYISDFPYCINQNLKMHFPIIIVLLFHTTLWAAVPQVQAVPVLQNEAKENLVDGQYAALKLILINDLGYTKEFADNVEINLKRAIKEEREKQKLQGVVPDRLRQAVGQVSEEDDDDEATTIGITTPGPSSGDIVRGIAQIFQSVGTFNVNSFWGSFVNFFPPNQREGAQALVEASSGRRPAKWPTIPTTTTPLPTTTIDEDEIDSDETTKSAVTTASVATATQPGATAAQSVTAAAAPAVSASQQPAASTVTEAATRAPASRYTIRPRTEAPSGTILRNADLGNFPNAANIPMPLEPALVP